MSADLPGDLRPPGIRESKSQMLKTKQTVKSAAVIKMSHLSSLPVAAPADAVDANPEHGTSQVPVRIPEIPPGNPGASPRPSAAADRRSRPAQLRSRSFLKNVLLSDGDADPRLSLDARFSFLFSGCKNKRNDVRRCHWCSYSIKVTPSPSQMIN